MSLESHHLENKIWILVGTRPEVIKQVPLYKSLKSSALGSQVSLVGTGQHKELITQALMPFGVELDFNLELQRQSSDLNELASKILGTMGDLMRRSRPRAIVVQGDTTSGAMAALAAFHQKIPVFHNEAGLRSHDLSQPFPEEANRKIISVVADLHFAPTELAQEALLKEGVSSSKITVTGNTGIDAFLWAVEQKSTNPLLDKIKDSKKTGNKFVLVTAHRRENEGTAMEKWYGVLKSFLEMNSDYVFISPLHPNNLARQAIEKVFGEHSRLLLPEPLDYVSTCQILKQCEFVVTDSGGIQEEAVTLGIPTLVCRMKTERSEGVTWGLARLANPQNSEELQLGLQWAQKLASEGHQPANVYGDGKASSRISKILVERFQ